jgi:hypothetical protein
MKTLRISQLVLCGAVLLCLSSLASASTTVYAALPYLSFADSPFNPPGTGYFYLEDFEDGLLNTPGVTASAGFLTSLSYPHSVIDSVDGDDGSIDGHGNDGESWFASNGATGITFTFNPLVLGSLPTQAGIVWTDGRDPITVRFYDGSSSLLAEIVASGIADGDNNFTGGTAEDRFFGMDYSGGIGSVFIASGAGVGIEVDHLQYGGGLAIPSPGALLLAAIGAGLIGWMRRRTML